LPGLSSYAQGASDKPTNCFRAAKIGKINEKCVSILEMFRSFANTNNPHNQCSL
jgi:hypothetical protein